MATRPEGFPMSRPSLASLLVALFLVACDFPSTSSSTQPPVSGVCRGFEGHWSKDTVYIEDAGGIFDTIGIRTELEFTRTSYSLEWYGTYRRKTQLEHRSLGTLKVLDTSMLERIPTKVYTDDDETGEFGLSSDPQDYTPDTLLISFPAAGRMKVQEKGSDGSGIVLTCR